MRWFSGVFLPRHSAKLSWKLVFVLLLFYGGTIERADGQSIASSDRLNGAFVILAHNPFIIECKNKSHREVKGALRFRAVNRDLKKKVGITLHAKRRAFFLVNTLFAEDTAGTFAVKTRSRDRRAVQCSGYLYQAEESIASTLIEMLARERRISPSAKLRILLQRGMKSGDIRRTSGRSFSPGNVPSPVAECEDADVYPDGIVDSEDLMAIMDAWGIGGPPYDLTDDGLVNSDDIARVLSCYGASGDSRGSSSISSSSSSSSSQSSRSSSSSSSSPLPRAHPVGMNAAGGIVDWTVGHIFKNVFKSVREWGIVSLAPLTLPEEQHVAAMRSDVVLTTDENGYPLAVPFTSPLIRKCNGAYTADRRGCTSTWGAEIPLAVNTLFFTDHTYYPAGNYTLVVEGTGAVMFGFDSMGPSVRWRELPVQGPKTTLSIPVVNAGNATAIFYLTRSAANDHIRSIKLLFPGETEESERANPLYNPYLDGLRSFTALRAWGEMYLERSNPADRLEWEERTPPDFYTQTAKHGMAWEYRIETANQLGQDLWITVPYQASDEYVRKLAQLIREKLSSELRLLVEYSNETWNYAGSFNLARQFTEERGRALELVPEGTPRENEGFAGGHVYSTLRLLEIGKIFIEELGEDKVELVMGSQASSPHGVSSLRLAAQNDSRVREILGDDIPSIGYLAIAPYFGNNTSQEILNDSSIDIFSSSETILVEKILQKAEQYLACHTAEWIRAHRALLDSYNGTHGTRIKLAAYELGQHLVSDNFDEAHAFYRYRGRARGDVARRLGDLYLLANRHPRMAALYQALYHTWFSDGQGDLLMNFFYVEKAHQTQGAWGMLDYLIDQHGERQPISEATTPKMFAALELVNNLVAGRPVGQGAALNCLTP